MVKQQIVSCNLLYNLNVWYLFIYGFDLLVLVNLCVSQN